jgi:hypothetical protein
VRIDSFEHCVVKVQKDDLGADSDSDEDSDSSDSSSSHQSLLPVRHALLLAGTDPRGSIFSATDLVLPSRR